MNLRVCLVGARAGDDGLIYLAVVAGGTQMLPTYFLVEASGQGVVDLAG